jgi:organic radical activating enzyme
MKYMDFRFSNVCNFRCRSCGPQLSSRWNADAKKIWPRSWDKTWNGPAILKVVNNSTVNWEEIEGLLPDLEEIYFAGGEPLIMEEHYRILKLLEDKELYHVNLRYNTNFSEMKFKGQDVMKIWNKFQRVEVGASLDASYKRGEYMRKGQEWDQVIRNRERMLKVCPDVRFYLSVTISLMNVWHLPDFHREWVEKGYIKVNEINDNILIFPNYYRIQVLPEKYKAKIRAKYKEYIEGYLSQQKENDRALRCFNSTLTFLDQKDMTNELPALREYTQVLDEIRGENFEEVFPELKGIMEGPTENRFNEFRE